MFDCVSILSLAQERWGESVIRRPINGFEADKLTRRSRLYAMDRSNSFDYSKFKLFVFISHPIIYPGMLGGRASGMYDWPRGCQQAKPHIIGQFDL